MFVSFYYFYYSVTAATLVALVLWKIGHYRNSRRLVIRSIAMFIVMQLSFIFSFFFCEVVSFGHYGVTSNGDTMRSGMYLSTVNIEEIKSYGSIEVESTELHFTANYFVPFESFDKTIVYKASLVDSGGLESLLEREIESLIGLGHQNGLSDEEIAVEITSFAANATEMYGVELSHLEFVPHQRKTKVGQ